MPGSRGGPVFFHPPPALAFGLLAFACMAKAASQYDAQVLADRPLLYLPLAAPLGATYEPDKGQGAHVSRYHGNPRKTLLPNGERATVFDGATQYVEVDDKADLSVSKGRAITLEAWMRPDTLQFPNDEGDGYVHWAGKGETGQHEYVLRMYSLNNSANRPNRISGYAFNPDGGLGSGSYFQDSLQAGRWIHVAVVINAHIRPGDPLKQTVSIFKNGVLRKTTSLSQFQVTPRPGNAPLRLGTRDLRSFFKGALGKFALYGYPLSEAQLKAHYQLMR